MKIATIGTGGIGGYLAVKLSNAGFKVATVARGPHLAAIKKNGLILDGPNGIESAIPWKATDKPSEIGEVDTIIFGVKCGALEAAAKACKPILKKETLLVPFLNGVETVERLLQILPKRNVANGVAKVSTTINGPGVIKQTGDFNTFIFAECNNKPSARIKDLQEAINRSGAIAQETGDIEKEMWSKFIMFSAISGVTATARCTLGQIVEMPSLGEVFKKIISETTSIARAYEISLPPDFEEKTWERAKKLPSDVRASTAIDLEKGLPIEVDWISGAAVRLARTKGLETPTNEIIYGLLSLYKNGISK